jgi:hypothetical protein
MNVAMALGAGMSFQLLGVGVTVLDVVAWVVAGGMLCALGVRAARNLRTLAAAEPPATPRIA